MLVANPAASRFTQTLHGDVIRILERGFDVYAPWPDSPAQALAAAQQAAHIGYDVVVAMGGDGTAHIVANGLFGSATALSVIPAGTTNVLARLLGLGNRPRAAAQAIATGGTATRSLLTLGLQTSGPRGDETRIATFAAGVGFDAEVIERSERRPLGKVGLGAIHYARSALGIAAGYRDRLPTLRVEAGARAADAVGVIVQAHDELTYIGRRPVRLGPPPGPMALSVDQVRTSKAIAMAARAALRQRLDKVKGATLWRSFDSLQVSAEPPALAEADGEVLGLIASITITPQPEGLLVLDTGAGSDR